MIKTGLTSISEDIVVTNSNTNPDVENIRASGVLPFECFQSMCNGCKSQIDVVEITQELV